SQGDTRFSDASKWWAELVSHSTVTDEVGEPGTGLVAFGSFAFADEPGDSVLVVPSVVVGRRGDVAWVTTVSTGSTSDSSSTSDSGWRWELAEPPPPAAPREVTFADGALDGGQWMSVVADAVARINNGDLEKVVLARDLVATAADPVDVRWPLQQLSTGYP